MFEFPLAVVIYCLLVGAVFCALGYYYDRRGRIAFELELRRSAFHCIKCDLTYTGTAGVGVCRCPRCDHENSRLRF
jgi:hypothetical protein